MMVRSSVRNLSMGLSVIGLSGCAGQMPSVGNFMHPDLVSVHGSIRGMFAGGAHEKWMEDPGRPPPGECEDRTYTLSDPSLWVNQSAYIGDVLRLGVDGSLFGVGSAVGGLRYGGFGWMPWLNFDLWQSEGDGLGGMAFAYRWQPTRSVFPGVFGYAAVNRALLSEPSCAMYSTPTPSPYTEVGLGGWIHLGERSNLSVETKVGKELHANRYRAYFGMNLHFGWDSSFSEADP